MKEKLFDIRYNLNYSFLMRNIVLLESNPDYTDNTKAVFDEMIKRKYNNKYKLIWVVDDKKEFKNIRIKNVKFIQRDNKFINKIVFKYYNLFSKYIIDCNKYIKKINKNQFRIHLSHGTPIKIAFGYNSKVGNVDYIIQVSDFFTDINAQAFNVDKKKLLSLGFPRNDILVNNKKTINLFSEDKNNKFVVWLPTYRNHKKDKDTNEACFPYCVPTITKKSEIEKLNKFLFENNEILIIKPHPAEDVSKLLSLNLSNIKIINDKYLKEKNISLYELLASSNALITDYSSVYYDYLLTDKPIGIAAPDIEEYRKKVGLLFDDYENSIVGEYIYNIKDLITFFENIANNKDIKKEERTNKKKLYNKYYDGKSTERILDLFEKNRK